MTYNINNAVSLKLMETDQYLNYITGNVCLLTINEMSLNFLSARAQPDAVSRLNAIYLATRLTLRFFGHIAKA